MTTGVLLLGLTMMLSVEIELSRNLTGSSSHKAWVSFFGAGVAGLFFAHDFEPGWWITAAALFGSLRVAMLGWRYRIVQDMQRPEITMLLSLFAISAIELSFKQWGYFGMISISVILLACASFPGKFRTIILFIVIDSFLRVFEYVLVNMQVFKNINTVDWMMVSGIAACVLSMKSLEIDKTFNKSILFWVILGGLYTWISLTISPALAYACTIIGYTIAATRRHICALSK